MKSSGSEKKTSSPLLIADPDPNWIRIRVLCGSEDKDIINHLGTCFSYRDVILLSFNKLASFLPNRYFLTSLKIPVFNYLKK